MNESLRVLVTGGAGFIGSHVADLLLAAGHQVAVLDDMSSGTPDNVASGIELFRADIRDAGRVREIMQGFRPSLVCHQAAHISVSRSVREPALDAQSNVLGLLHVLEEGVRAGVTRFVFAASGGTLYGEVNEPATEDHPGSPVSPYGISKWAGERYLEFFTREHGVDAVALRYANVYGPRQNPHGEAGVVAIFCDRFKAGKAAVLNGGGNCIRDYVFVTDVARANYLALTRPLPHKFNAFNVGTSAPTTVKQLEEVLRHHMERVLNRQLPAPLEGPPRPGDLRSSLLGVNLASSVLDWKPEVDIAEGLRRTAEWYVSLDHA